MYNLIKLPLFNLCSRPGGDKIYGVFDNQLPAAMKRLQFDKHLSMDNVRKLITEADGYQPHLIAPEQGYRRLIESCLTSIRGPAEAAVDAVCSCMQLVLRSENTIFCMNYLNLTRSWWICSIIAVVCMSASIWHSEITFPCTGFRYLCSTLS